MIRLEGDPVRDTAAGTWPREHNGHTVWACCLSVIGPACQHRANPDGTVQLPRVGELTYCSQVGHYGQHAARPDCLLTDSRGRCQTPRPAVD